MTRSRHPALGSLVLPLAFLLFEGRASSNAPVGHYRVTENTALDTRTNLRWMRGFAPGVPSGSLSWSETAQVCQSLTLDGYVGWRLPTARELESLYDFRSSEVMLDRTVFLNAPSAGAIVLWSSTEVVGDASKVEGRHFLTRTYNGTNRSPIAKTDNGGARCVRDP